MDPSSEPSRPALAVDVLVDGAPSHMGALSYLVPPDSAPERGDAVEVPFGRRVAHGVVIGPGDPARATREISRVWGARIHPGDLDVAEQLALRHLSTLPAMAPRFAPRDGKGDDPFLAGEVSLPDPVHLGTAVEDRYLLRAPALDPARLAATAAAELAGCRDGQVLVLCPTRALASAVVGCFASGAALLDAPGGWTGFRAGTVPVGVGTRTAALWSPRTLAGIVVVEEDHPGHVEARQPHTNARDVAVARARARGVPLVLTGMCPTGSGLGAKVKAAAVGEFPKLRVVEGSQRSIPAAALAATAAALRSGRSVAVLAPVEAPKPRCVNCRALRTEEEGSCSRCGERGTRLSGWDPAKLASVFPAGVKVLGPKERPRSAVDLLVLLDADRPARRPGFEPEAAVARLVLAAAADLAPGGELLCTASDPSDPALASMRRGHVPLAKVLWSRARQDNLPPFGHLVRILVSRRTAPSLARWPGAVFGPRAVAEGEWEILVRLGADALTQLTPFVERLRRSGKLRLTVS